MGLTIIIKRSQPRFVPVRMEPAPNQRAHLEVIVPGYSAMEPGEQEEILGEVNERTGRKHTADEMEEQVEQRIKGTYKKEPKFERPS